jgi:cytochrome d ubiquinol oxidase subunit I
VSVLDLSRWQFSLTTIYHFLFVPSSIGLAVFTAAFHTAWHRTRKPEWLRLARFFGKLMLISFAVGVVTGIVLEFQFGMNWSGYSRFVGDVFGAPLAVEALAAFFVESTFLGVWIFGWGRIPARLHLASIWLVALASSASAFFILAANSWMQHPVGYEIDAAAGRAEMTSFWALISNSTLLYAFPHTVLGALATGGMIVLGIAGYCIVRGREPDLFARAIKVALPVVFVATVATATIGHFQAQLMTEQQPMKMAAAEALYETEKPAGFSLFALGGWESNPGEHVVNVTIPHALTVLSTNSWNGEVRGIDDIQAEYRQRYGPGDYAPIVGVTYWTFRLMVGAGTLMILFSLAGLWLWRRRRLETSTRYLRLALPLMALPFVANITGWIFTEVGRQPWVVQGLLTTDQAVSPNISVVSVALSLTVLTAIYGALAAVALWLTVRFVKAGPARLPAAEPGIERPDLALSY